MNFTNINTDIKDPAGVKALLDQLRVSQAWQEVATQPPSVDQTPEASDKLADSLTTPTSVDVDTTTSTSVAALLSQLRSSPSFSLSSQDKRNVGQSLPSTSHLGDPPFPGTTSRTPKKDTRSYTFQQALPHLARLAEKPEFVAAIKQMKNEQDDIERQLWEDRRNIHKKYEEKVKVAATKANMIGDGKISKHEADMIEAAFKRELERFDRERVLLAWDGVIAKQQAVFAQHDVPAMFISNSRTDRERQQRVIQVLEGLF